MLDLPQYRSRLAQIRSLVDRSRAAGTLERDRLLADATTLLRQTSVMTSRGEAIAIDDAPIAETLRGPDGANRAITLIDLEIASADRALRSRIDPAVADQRLHDIIGANNATGASATWLGALLASLQSWLAGFFSGLHGSLPDLWYPLLAVALMGVGLIVLIVAILGRGTRERIRREVFLPATAERRGEDPLAHLRRAEVALSEGRARDAIHELYLYAIRSLEARELIRYDPALTDRELLARAEAIPNAEALRELVAAYERSWFGLRDASPSEAERARGLARRVAP